MPPKPIISNNSPLVALLGLDLLSLLRELYTEVWIPEEVKKVMQEQNQELEATLAASGIFKAVVFAL